MKTLRFFLVLILALLITDCSSLAANIPTLNDPVAGAELAKKLRALVPAENQTIRAMLEMERPDRDEQAIPLTSMIVITNEPLSITTEP